MSDRDALLGRLAGPSGPSDPTLAAAWRALHDGDRDRLRRTATDPVAAAHVGDGLERTLVDALAADRVQRRTVDVVVPVVTALLVLSTVWGFGRAALPDIAGWTLLLGLLGGAIACVAGWRRADRRRTAARAVRAALRR